MYGLNGQGWFLSVHAFTRYLKVTFFRGASLDPLPPGPSASPDVRTLDIRENDTLDEAQSAAFLEGVFREELRGHRLLINRSMLLRETS